jgi:hypothetical protein
VAKLFQIRTDLLYPEVKKLRSVCTEWVRDATSNAQGLTDFFSSLRPHCYDYVFPAFRTILGRSSAPTLAHYARGNDDSISTAPTESEFSGPVALEPKSELRNGSGANSAGSSRSMLPPKHPSSSRGSGAPSPSFTYASIYDSAPNNVPYDAGQAPPIPQPYVQSLMYPCSPPPPPGQGPVLNFMPPVPCYRYGHAQSPPPLRPQHHTSYPDLWVSTRSPPLSSASSNSHVDVSSPSSPANHTGTLPTSPPHLTFRALPLGGRFSSPGYGHGPPSKGNFCCVSGQCLHSGEDVEIVVRVYLFFSTSIVFLMRHRAQHTTMRMHVDRRCHSRHHDHDRDACRPLLPLLPRRRRQR